MRNKKLKESLIISDCDLFSNNTYYGLQIEKVNEIDEKLYLLIRESLNDKEKDFLITEDGANKVYFTEALEQILYLIKTINETEVK
jgi:hypothetical protein